MDKASAYGAGDCRFESYRGHCLDTLLMTNDIKKRGYHVVIKERNWERQNEDERLCGFVGIHQLSMLWRKCKSQLAVWSSGMILASGARGPGFNSQNSANNLPDNDITSRNSAPSKISILAEKLCLTTMLVREDGKSLADFGSLEFMSCQCFEGSSYTVQFPEQPN